MLLVTAILGEMFLTEQLNKLKITMIGCLPSQKICAIAFEEEQINFAISTKFQIFSQKIIESTAFNTKLYVLPRCYNIMWRVNNVLLILYKYSFIVKVKSNNFLKGFLFNIPSLENTLICRLWWCFLRFSLTTSLNR